MLINFTQMILQIHIITHPVKSCVILGKWIHSYIHTHIYTFKSYTSQIINKQTQILHHVFLHRLNLTRRELLKSKFEISKNQTALSQNIQHYCFIFLHFQTTRNKLKSSKPKLEIKYKQKFKLTGSDETEVRPEAMLLSRRIIFIFVRCSDSTTQKP